MVTRTQLFGQMRRRVHRDRRTDQDLRVPGVLRVAAVQRVQRIRSPARSSVVGRVSGVFVLALENCRGSDAVRAVKTTVRHLLVDFRIRLVRSLPLVIGY